MKLKLELEDKIALILCAAAYALCAFLAADLDFREWGWVVRAACVAAWVFVFVWWAEVK